MIIVIKTIIYYLDILDNDEYNKLNGSAYEYRQL